jgi:hypothetical protein
VNRTDRAVLSTMVLCVTMAFCFVVGRALEQRATPSPVHMDAPINKDCTPDYERQATVCGMRVV